MLASLCLSLSCLLSLALALVLSTLLAPCPDTAQSSRLRLDVAESGVWSFHGSLGSDWDVDYIAKGYARTQGAKLQRLTAPTYPGEPFGEARRATLLRCGPHVQVGRHRRFKSGEARGAGYHSISSQSSEAQVCARPGRGCSVQLSQL